MAKVLLSIILPVFAYSLESVFEGVAAWQQISYFLVLCLDDDDETSHWLLFTHVLRIRMIIYRILTDPHLHISILVLKKHSLGNFEGTMDAHQFPQSLNRRNYLFYAPLLHNEQSVSVNVHIPEIFFYLCATSMLANQLEIP